MWAVCSFLVKGVWGWSHLLASFGDDAGAVGDVLDFETIQFGLNTKRVRAGGLVAKVEVGVLAPLVDAESALGGGDVEEREVVADPGGGLLAASDEVHGVRGGESKSLVDGLEEALALAHGEVFVGGRDLAAFNGVVPGGLVGDEVVVGIVGDVVGAAGLIDLKEIDATTVGGDADAQVVTAHSAGPVGDAVSVDLASEYTNGGRELIVRGDGDCVTLGGNRQGSGAGRKGGDGCNGEEHIERNDGLTVESWFVKECLIVGY
jgi:hypothetical protein